MTSLQKRQPYRNKKILKECHNQDNVCTIQLPGCQGSPTVPAHSNLADDGKGQGQKADDCFVAIACQHCHDVVDGRKPQMVGNGSFGLEYMLQSEIEWYHNRGIKRTIRIMLDRGVLK